MGERCYERHGRCYVLNIRWNLDQLQPYTILPFQGHDISWSRIS